MTSCNPMAWVVKRTKLNSKKGVMWKTLINNKQLLAEYKDSACLARQAAGGEQRQVRRICQRGKYPFFRREYPFFQKGIYVFRWIITHNSERWISFFQKGISFFRRKYFGWMITHNSERWISFFQKEYPFFRREYIKMENNS